MIRTLVIDDEQPARERLKQLLTAHPDVVPLYRRFIWAALLGVLSPA